MSRSNIFENPQWNSLQETFDAFLISFNEKWKAYKNAKKPEREWLYNESKDAWKSLENTKKEMFEMRKEYGLA
ncbi:MAG: hypothetical protein LV477_12295 [Candidatus Nitrosotalea sp.]|nr:hypothetical protein [Candidatus Nitrosotalea sp.]